MFDLSIIFNMETKWKYLLGENLTTQDFENYLREIFELNDVNILDIQPTNTQFKSLYLNLSSACKDQYRLDDKIYNLIMGTYEIYKENNPILVKKLGVETSIGTLLYMYTLGAAIPMDDGMIAMTFANYPNAEEIMIMSMSIDMFLGNRKL